MTENYAETNEMMDEGPLEEQRPILPVLPLPDVVIFPNSITPLFVVRPASLAAVDHAAKSDNLIFLVTQRSASVEQPGLEDLYEVGCISQILQVQRVPDNSVRIFIEGQTICRAVEYFQIDNMVSAHLAPLHIEEPPSDKRLTALRRTVINQFETYARLSEKIPEDLFINIKNLDDPLAQCHAVANYSSLKTEDKQAVLEMTSLSAKLLHLSQVFSTENELLGMESKILTQVKSQIGKNQKEYFLSEQLKVIEKELGLVSDEDVEIDELQKAIEESKMSEEARDRAEKELARLSRMAPMSPESTVSRTYIEWLLDFPWEEYTDDNLDLRRAMRILNQDHYGLEKVKERIVEYLAVLRLVGSGMRGPILCLVGPPGVGKTSLARSVAHTMGRRFARFSLGGVRDEAEIRGHRRTYIGALPGKIVQMMKKAGSANPVLLLDEIDKMNADFRGDPASALLEVLDPEQNKAFNDHYMEVDLDLSRVLFITTANTTDGIPWALRDRMEIIRLPGYTRPEKLEIARRYLVPRQTKENGLDEKKIEFPDDGLHFLIDAYTSEAGVRNLEREIAALARKVARRLATRRKKKPQKATVSPVEVRKLLGPVRYSDLEVDRAPQVGAAVGLAWTEVGGELLTVEATTMPGKGNLVLTGKLGDVMQESAKAAFSYARAHAAELGVPVDFHEKLDIHVHLPEGAIPKDGPSAGVTLLTALVSALSKRPVRQDVAMTGEITLRGRVLKIGGLKEKAIAAHRARIKTVLIPAENHDELQEIAPHVRKALKFVKVKDVASVLKRALADEEAAEDKSGKKPSTKRNRTGRRDPASSPLA